MQCCNLYTAIMPATAEQLWDAIERLAYKDGTADKIIPAVIAKLIEFKMVELGATGLPQLTLYGEKCYVVMESGSGVVPVPGPRYAKEHAGWPLPPHPAATFARRLPIAALNSLMKPFSIRFRSL